MKRFARVAFVLLVAGIALDLRTAGLFRGLDAGYVVHPDEPKQIQALSNYLAGRYVWYTGSWFYDGYPFGLNHVDEYILRPVLALARRLQTHLSPESAASEGRDRHDLFYWARGLRVAYGLAALALVAAAAARLGRRSDAAWTAALLAVAPLGAVVTHSATGDVGADLFTALALFLVAAHAARPRIAWLAAAGAAVGLGFACKYNAALAGLAPGLYVLLRVRRGRAALRQRAIELAALAAGAFAGAVAGTPASWLRWERTWRDVFVNFDRIRWFRVHPSWRELPLAERLLDSLGTNAPRVADALGWLLLAGALLGLLALARAWARAAREDAGRDAAAARLAISVAPWLALAVSIAGKPVVQPFHFSYLAGPFALGLVFAGGAWRARGAPGRIAAAALLAGALAESAVRARSERFFWSRDDIAAFHAFGSVVTDRTAGELHEHGTPVREFVLEPRNVSEFRNARRLACFRDGHEWTGLDATPLPTAPYPEDRDWIFLNGPAFPRDDRALVAEGGHAAERQLVAADPPSSIALGLRSGLWPTRVRLELGGRRAEVRLGPRDERIVSLPAGRWRTVRGFPPGRAVRLCRLRVEAELGDAWVTVLRSDAERRAYAAFGPRAAAELPAPPAWPEPTPGLLAALGRARFHEGPAARPVRMEAGAPGRADWILAPEETYPARAGPGGAVAVLDWHRSRPRLRAISAGLLAVPAGAYRLECEVTGLGPAGELRLRLADALGLDAVRPAEFRQPFAAGDQTIAFPFEKRFAPHQLRIELSCTAGSAMLLGWRLVPDAPRILGDLRAWSGGGPRPAWMCPPAPAQPDGRLRTRVAATFAGMLRIEHLGRPREASAGGTLDLDFEAQLDRFDASEFDDLDFYIHLRGADGARAWDGGVPVAEALARHEAGFDVRLPIAADLRPGLYDMYVGVYNRATRHQLKASVDAAGAVRLRGRSAFAGPLRVRPAEPAAANAGQ